MSMKTKTNYVHVVPNGKEWKVVRPNASRASGIYSKKSDAMDKAKRIARNSHAYLVEHRKDGRIGNVTNPKDKR